MEDKNEVVQIKVLCSPYELVYESVRDHSRSLKWDIKEQRV